MEMALNTESGDILNNWVVLSGLWNWLGCFTKILRSKQSFICKRKMKHEMFSNFVF